MVFGRVSVFQCQRTMLFVVGVIGYSLQLSQMVRIGSKSPTSVGATLILQCAESEKGLW